MIVLAEMNELCSAKFSTLLQFFVASSKRAIPTLFQRLVRCNESVVFLFFFSSN